jgi:hypothetical protein
VKTSDNKADYCWRGDFSWLGTEDAFKRGCENKMEEKKVVNEENAGSVAVLILRKIQKNELSVLFIDNLYSYIYNEFCDLP